MLFYDKVNDFYLSVENDTTVLHPREFFDYDSTMITFEKDYSSPDSNPFNTWEDMMKHFKTDFTGNRKEDLEQLQANALKQGVVLMPVWKYEHSGLAYSAADRNPFPDDGWDSGLCGVIYENVNDRDIEEVRNEFKDQVEEWSKYASGEVYCISAYDIEGNEICYAGCIYKSYNSFEDMAIEETTSLEWYDDGKTPKLEEVSGSEYESVQERIAAHQKNFNEYAQETPSYDDEER